MQRMLGESLMLALVAGALGLLIAQIGVELIAALGMTDLPRGAEIAVDGRVFAFTLGLSLAAGLLYGLIPAWQVSRVRVAAMMKEGGSRTSLGPTGQRIRAVLTVGEVAIACVLLVAAGLMIRSSLAIRSTDPGFAHENVLGLTLWADQPRDADTQWSVRYFDELLAQVEAVAGVRSASLINGMPWQFMFDTEIEARIDGHPDFEGAEPAIVKYRVVSDDYLQAMEIPLRAGRYPRPADDADAPAVVVVSEQFAERFWPEGDALGQRVQLGPDAEDHEIVGVVAGVRERRLDRDPVAMLYLPFRQNPSVAMTVMVRTDRDPALLEQAVQRAVWSITPDQGIWRTVSLSELLDGSLQREKLYMRLLVIFAVVAVLLAAAGVYGVISFSVTQRTHEIGIRMALGAQNREVLGRVLLGGVRLALIGLGVGLPVSFLVARLLASLFYDVGPLDPATYLGVGLLVVCVTLAACYVPARRAVRIQPALGLRAD